MHSSSYVILFLSMLHGAQAVKAIADEDSNATDSTETISKTCDSDTPALATSKDVAVLLQGIWIQSKISQSTSPNHLLVAFAHHFPDLEVHSSRVKTLVSCSDQKSDCSKDVQCCLEDGEKTKKVVRPDKFSEEELSFRVNLRKKGDINWRSGTVVFLKKGKAMVFYDARRDIIPDGAPESTFWEQADVTKRQDISLFLPAPAKDLELHKFMKKNEMQLPKYRYATEECTKAEDSTCKIESPVEPAQESGDSQLRFCRGRHGSMMEPEPCYCAVAPSEAYKRNVEFWKQANLKDTHVVRDDGVLCDAGDACKVEFGGNDCSASASGRLFSKPFCINPSCTPMSV